MNLTHPRLVAWLIGLGVLFVSAWERFAKAHLWAEDGSVFLYDALHQSPQVLFQQYAGYYHTLPRVFTEVALLFPLDIYPQVICFLCFLAYAWFVSELASPSFRLYLPSDWIRVSGVVLLCGFLPGRVEVLGNVANIHWVCFIYLWLLALRPYPLAIRPWEVGLAVLCVFSAGEAILIAPLFVLRMVLRFWHFQHETSEHTSLKLQAGYSEKRAFFVLNSDGTSRKWSYWPEAVLTLLIGGCVILNIIHTSDFLDSTPQEKGASVGLFLDSLQSTVQTHLLYQPWLGIEHLGKLQSIPAYRFWEFLASVFLVWVVFRVWGMSSGLGVQKVSGILMLLMLPVMIWVVRPNSMSHFHNNMHSLSWWEWRYSFALGVAGIMLWYFFWFSTHVGRSYRFHQVKQAVGVLFIGVYLYQNWILGPVRSYGHSTVHSGTEPVEYDPVWKDDVPILIQSIETGCPASVQVLIHPKDWSLHYRGAVSGSCSE